MSQAVPPEAGWRVRILDLSTSGEDAVIEEVGGFPTLGQANGFARRYVRDSIERCRQPGATAHQVLDAWFAFGEDVEVLDPGGEGWRSATELNAFAARRADAAERDWRALDPRRSGANRQR